MSKKTKPNRIIPAAAVFQINLSGVSTHQLGISIHVPVNQRKKLLFAQTRRGIHQYIQGIQGKKSTCVYPLGDRVYRNRFFQSCFFPALPQVPAVDPLDLGSRISTRCSLLWLSLLVLLNNRSKIAGFHLLGGHYLLHRGKFQNNIQYRCHSPV